MPANPLKEKSSSWIALPGGEELLGEHILRKDAYTQAVLDALDLIGVAVREHPDAKGKGAIPLDCIYGILRDVEVSVSEDRAYTVLPLKLDYLDMRTRR